VHAPLNLAVFKSFLFKKSGGRKKILKKGRSKKTTKEKTKKREKEEKEK